MQSEEYLSPLNTGEALVFVLGSDVKASEARISGLIDSLRERDARINQFTRDLAEAEEALAAADAKRAAAELLSMTKSWTDAQEASPHFMPSL